MSAARFLLMAAPMRQAFVLCSVLIAVIAATRLAAAEENRGSHLDVAAGAMVLRYEETAYAAATVHRGFGVRVMPVIAFGQGWGIGPGLRLGGVGTLVGGLEVALHHRFDRFTGEIFAPYVVAGVTTLFGPSSSNNDLLPLPDLGAQLGVGFDFRLGSWFRLGPDVRWNHPILARKAYTGPIDLGIVASFDL